MKKKISITLALVMILSMVLSIGAYAKVNLPSISKNKPIITYTYNSSGKVYAYKAADLKTKTGGYIACSTDQCKIIEIKGNAVKVTYPVSKGTKTAWFSRDAFTKRNLANDAAQSSFNSQIKATTYKWKNNSATLGYVSKGDKVYLLRGDAKSNWLQILYPVSGGYKMGWITGSDYNKMITPTATPTATPKPTAKPVATPNPTAKPTAKPMATPKPTATPNNSGWQWPVNSKSITQTFGHNGHLGVDLKSGTNRAVYAAADGKVVAVGLNGTGTDASVTKNKSGNGYYVVLEHTLSGKKVYSMYGHLKKGSTLVKKGQSVSKGAKIATYGNTGNSTGPHTHFAIADTYKPGSYYGYTSGNNTFSANKYKESRSKVTFYNPSYVIKYNKLPK